MSQTDPTFLSDDEWRWVTSHLPIACVDIVPIQPLVEGPGIRVGLIRRVCSDDSEERIVWCHLGGRINLDEVLVEAAHRHLDETLSPTAGAVINPKAVTVAEFLRHPRIGVGRDPSKHAVSAVFVADFPAGILPNPQGEALSFKWFTPDDIPDVDDFWPGSREIVLAALKDRQWQHVELSYQTLSSSFVTHNQLMWQTPVLAMTAMAFLLTIALGDGEGWSRALAGGLSAVTAFASMQLMAKHSYSQIRDAELLLKLENENGMRPLNAHQPVKRVTGRGAFADFENWLVTLRSRRVWFHTMFLFGLASVAIALLAIAGVS